MRTILTLLVALGWAGVAHAQAARPAQSKTESTYVSLEQMKAVEQKAMKDGKITGFSTRFFQDSKSSTAFIRLIAPDTPHAHGAWSEVFVVREGSGILETGGTITGVTGTNSATHGAIFTDENGAPRPATPAPAAAAGRTPTPGDLAGTGIEGGKQQHVKPGDLILIPAGVAHRWIKLDGPAVVYLDIKFPKE